MVDINEARERTKRARQQITTARTQIATAREILTKQKGELPDIRSQRALRRKFRGLKGRLQRREVIGVEKKIAGQQKKITTYETGALAEAEKSVAQAEAEIRTYDQKQAAIKAVNKMASKGKLWMLARWGTGFERQYARELMEQQNLEQQEMQNLLDNPEKLKIKVDKLMEKGLTEEVAYGKLGFKLTQRDTKFDAKVTDLKSTLSPELFEKRKFVKSPDGKGYGAPLYKPGEKSKGGTYVPAVGGFITQSPTGVGATGYIRPPTIYEKAAIDKAARAGAEAFDVVVKKVVTPTLKFVEPVTGYVRDIPIVQKGSYLADVTGGKERTVGSLLLKGTEKGKEYGSESKRGFDLTSGYFGEKAEKEGKGVKKNVLEGLRDISKGTGYVAKAAPSILQYMTLGLMGGAAVDIVAVEEKKAKPEKYVQEAFEKEYSLYDKAYGDDSKIARQEGVFVVWDDKLSKEEFKDKYYGDIETRVKKGIEGEAVIPLALFATGGAIKGYKLVKSAVTPKVIKSSIKGGDQFTLRYTEQQVPKMVGEKVKVYSKFKIVSGRTPVTAYKQSWFGKVFGTKPKLVVLQKGQTYITQPVMNTLGKPVIVGERYLARTARVGKGGRLVNQKFSIVAGDEKGLAKESLANLPRTENYLWRDIIQKKTGGIPVKKGTEPLFFADDVVLSRGEVYKLDISKLGTGRSLSTVQTGSVSRTIKDFGKGGGIFDVQTGFKDVTKVFPRASGNIKYLEGTVIRAPLIVPETASKVGTSFMGGGKKSSADFLKQLYATQKVVPIVKPVINVPKPSSIPTVVTTPSVVVETPLMVGGAGLKTLPYAGQGMYEAYITETMPKVSQGNLMDVTPKVILDTSQSSYLDQAPKTFQTGQTKILPQLKVDAIQSPVLKVLPAQKPVSKLSLQQRYRLQLRNMLRQSSSQRRTTRPPKPPTTSKFLRPSGGKGIFGFKLGSKGTGFKVYVAKGGKDVKIGTKKTLKGAKRLLKTRLLTTLRAGGFIERRKKKVRINLGAGFRPSKVNPLRVVQKKAKRFGTRTEAILGVKSRKGRRKSRAKKKKK